MHRPGPIARGRLFSGATCLCSRPRKWMRSPRRFCPGQSTRKLNGGIVTPRAIKKRTLSMMPLPGKKLRRKLKWIGMILIKALSMMRGRRRRNCIKLIGPRIWRQKLNRNSWRIRREKILRRSSGMKNNPSGRKINWLILVFSGWPLPAIRMNRMRKIGLFLWFMIWSLLFWMVILNSRPIWKQYRWSRIPTAIWLSWPKKDPM